MSESRELAQAAAMAELHKARALRKFEHIVREKLFAFQVDTGSNATFLYLGDEEKTIWNILIEQNRPITEEEIRGKNRVRRFMGLFVLFVSADSHLNVA